MNSTSEFGAWSENYVAQYLTEKDYLILDRNYRRIWGELDIVCKKDDLIIFIEVKANKSEAVGFEPENRVNSEKLRRMNRVIQTYLSHKKYSPEQDWQIDIISLTLDRNRGVAKIKHFKNIEI